MAPKCGRCGLWEKTPEDYKYQDNSGACLYTERRTSPGEEWEECVFVERRFGRNVATPCPHFVEKIAPHSPSWHFEQKCQMEGLKDTYKEMRMGRFFSLAAIIMSIIALTLELL